MSKPKAETLPTPTRRQGTDVIIGATAGDVDIQVATAKRYPRDPEQSLERAIALATIDRETADSCIYALPRGGKIIEGPSVRLTEIAAGGWGNTRVAAKGLGEDETYTYAQAVCWDCETNTAIQIETKRRITDKKGRRYNDDMIEKTSNAGVSIALRNSILRVLPRDYINQIYQAARRKLAEGDGKKSLEDRRSEMLAYFAGLKVTEKQICELLNISAIEELTGDMIATLRGVAVSIKEGVADVHDIFKPRKKAKDTKRAESTKGQEDTPATQDDISANNNGAGDESNAVDPQNGDIITQIKAELHQRWPGITDADKLARRGEIETIFGVTTWAELTALTTKILRKGLVELQRRAGEAELDEAGLTPPESTPAEAPPKVDETKQKMAIFNEIFDQLGRLINHLDGPALTAERNRLLKETFGTHDVDRIGELPLMMMRAGLRSLTDLANSNVENNGSE